MDPHRLYQSLEFASSWSFARSSGPGGQNVNKVNTKAVLRIDLEKVDCLSPESRIKVWEKLASRIDAEGHLQITVQESRSQFANRELALDRAVKLILMVLAPVKHRKPTRATKGSKERRLMGKRLQSLKKSIRRDLGD